MKAAFSIFALLILSGCHSHTITVSDVNNSIQHTSAIDNSNSRTIGQNTYSDYKYDKVLLDKLNAENEKFKQVPDEFKSVDFKNFKYDFGRLKNGELERYQNNKRLDGTEQYSFNDVFYIDLIGDAKKEAVVFVVRVTCGGSCDGGAYYVYFYSSVKSKPQLIDNLKTGTNAYGCSLKAFTVKNKKINVEQFGRCQKDKIKQTDGMYACKFCVKDETHSFYSISGNKLRRESADIFETETINVMNSPAFISISE